MLKAELSEPCHSNLRHVLCQARRRSRCGWCYQSNSTGTSLSGLDSSWLRLLDMVAAACCSVVASEGALVSAQALASVHRVVSVGLGQEEAELESEVMVHGVLDNVLGRWA